MDGIKEKNAVTGSTLYLVSTPIGNMSDISERALKVLSEVSFVAAEDTRNTGLFLKRLNISKPLISYHKFNEASRCTEITKRLLSGESCALVSDAGTPVISDPGGEIVRMCVDNGIKVVSIPGCCAAVSALTVSGIDARRFVFEGFLPVQSRERKERLEEIEKEKRTIIIYESPHKLKRTLSDLMDVLNGERKISLCRELTKLNEEVIRTTLDDAVAFYSETEPKGEYVLVIEGYSSVEYEQELSPKEQVEALIETGMSKMDAIKTVSKKLKIDKNELYTMFVNRSEQD